MTVSSAAPSERPAVPLVLVASPNADWLLAVGLMLERDGFRIETARLASAIRARLALAKPDLLLVDLALLGQPEDGEPFDASVLSGDVPFIAMSAEQADDVPAKALDYGVIGPPFLSRLPTMVTRALALAARERALRESEDIVREGRARLHLDTSRVASESRQLQEHQQRLDDLVSRVPVGILLTDRDGRCTYVNASATTLLDVTPADALEMGWSRHVLEEDRDRVMTSLRQAALHAGPSEVEFRCARPGGGSCWLFAQSAPVSDPGGIVIGCVAAITDITASKAVEEGLRTSDAQVRAIFQLTSVGIVQADPYSSRLLRVNDAFSKMTGYSATELTDRTLLSLTCPSDQPASREGLSKLVRGETTAYVGEARLMRKDGTLFWAQVTVNLVRDGGVPRQAVAIVTDVTERRRAEEGLARAHEQLEQRVAQRTAELEARTRQLRRLASDLTLAEQRTREDLAKTLHDGLQQLLFGARLQIDRVARGEGQLSPGKQDALERVRGNLDEAIGATRALSLELSPPVLREAGLAAGLEWLVVRKSDTYSLRVQLRLDPKANPESQSVRVFVYEAVRELLFNVVKHADAREAAVELDTVQDGGLLRVAVVDQGRGFDPAIIRRRVGESGLGLYTISERAALLGGRLEIESAPGKGSRFTLFVPRLGSVLVTEDADAVTTPGVASVEGNR